MFNFLFYAIVSFCTAKMRLKAEKILKFYPIRKKK